MSSAGTSGTSNAETDAGANLNGTPVGMENIGDTPVETVEIIEVIETANPYEYAANGSGSTIFRWWYVPAIALPIVAGGAAIWYARKGTGAQPFVDARDLLARKGSDFKDLLQEQTKQLPGKASDLKGKSAATIGAVASAGVLDKIGDTLADLRGSTVDLMERTKPRERVVAVGQATRAQVAQARQMAAAKQARAQAASKWNDFTDMVGSAATGWIAAQRVRERARAIQERAADKASDLKIQKRTKVASSAAKTGATAAAMRTSKAVSKAGDRASRAAHNTGKRARSTWKRTRAFTFGMLVTAMATYLRIWQQRVTEKTTRETAGGRLVRDA